MQSNSMIKAILAVALCVSLLATGCTAKWIGVALADLPVLTQMALNIATLVSAMQSGKQVNPAQVAAIQNISAQASRDLNLLQTLYNEYKANPGTTTLQKIESVVADINQNLPALLQAAAINDPALAGRINAGVNLILTTVQSFAALIPSATKTARTVAGRAVSVPNPSELKARWNQEVCGPSGDAAIDIALAECVIR